jgi:signal transduction histidine kinase
MRRRVLVSLGLLLLLFLLGDAIALWSMNRSIDRLSDLAESHRIQSMRSSLASGGLRVERDTLSHLLGLGRPLSERHEGIWRFKDAILQCRSCHHAPEIQGLLVEVGERFEGWLAAADPVFLEPYDNPLDEDENTAVRSIHGLVQMTRDMSERAHDRLLAEGDEARESVHNAWIALCVTLVVALIAGGIVAFHLHASLTKPVDELLREIDRARASASDTRFEIHGDREFRKLGEAFHTAYRDLASAQDGVLQAEKMAAMGKLAAGVAHEVGNPLASISSIAQIMRRRLSSEEDIRQIDLIMDHIRRISEIVRDMLKFSRPYESREDGTVDVVALLERARGLLAYDKRSTGVRVDCEYPEDLAPVRADADRLLLVFTNIIINAFDALAERNDEGGALEISAFRSGDRVVIRFHDNGPGMTEREIANAFEPFFTTKQPGAGTGLGLWICYETVRRFDGSIRIESEPGEGTSVTIELPVDGRA